MYKYINTATFATNQKMSCTRSRTGGISSTNPMRPSRPANPASPIVWILKYGCFGMRTTPRAAKPASTRKVAAGNKEKINSHGCPLSQFGNGRNHPPSHRVTATEETAIMAAYSPSMNNDQRSPLYSV